MWLYLPESSEPAPLIMFSHGLGGHPDKFETVHDAWARAGYAVAAPAFPLTNDKVPGSFGNGGDVVDQPGDISFVLDHLLAESADPDSTLAGRFDADRLGAAGLSLGGATTYEVGVNEGPRDDRFRAAMVMSGAAITNPDDGSFVAADVPVYLLHGDADLLIPLDVPQRFYDALAGPSYYVTLVGGGHAGPFEDEGGFEPKIDGMDDVVHESTIAFWDLHLSERAEAAEELGASAAVEGLSVFVEKDG